MPYFFSMIYRKHIFNISTKKSHQFPTKFSMYPLVFPHVSLRDNPLPIRIQHTHPSDKTALLEQKWLFYI